MKTLLGIGVLALLAAAVAARLFVFDWVIIDGQDMAPTLELGDHVVVNHLDKRPTRGQLILFDVPGGSGAASVRRVVGVPGDRIEYRNQGLLWNKQPAHVRAEGHLRITIGPLDRTLDRYRETLPTFVSSYAIARDPQRRSKDQPAVVVPEGAFYVLSDNRNHGRDSREYGVVPAANVRGIVLRKATSLVHYEPID
jgi:signal peptidase I